MTCFFFDHFLSCLESIALRNSMMKVKIESAVRSRLFLCGFECSVCMPYLILLSFFSLQFRNSIYAGISGWRDSRLSNCSANH